LCDREQGRSGSIRYSLCDARGGPRIYVLLIVGAVIVFIVVVVTRIRVRARVNAGSLGWMSERWLAEHRVSESR